MYVHMYVFSYVCMYVCMFLCIYVRTYAVVAIRDVDMVYNRVCGWLCGKCT